MGIRDLLKKLQQPTQLKVEPARFSLLKTALFTLIFIIVFPIGILLSVKYAEFFSEIGLTFLTSPVVYILLIIPAAIFFSLLEAKTLWSQPPPELENIRFAPTEAPISIIFFMGFLAPALLGTDQVHAMLKVGSLLLINAIGV